MYFYKDILLSLNRCVKKSANIEARCCQIVQEESLPLCLFLATFPLSVFQCHQLDLPRLLRLLFFWGMAFLVNLGFVGLCQNLFVEVWRKQPPEQFGFCPVTVLFILSLWDLHSDLPGILISVKFCYYPLMVPYLLLDIVPRSEGCKHAGERG